MYSNRCPNKHKLEFYNGKTLVDLKLEQMLDSGCDHVYVSTDDHNAVSTDNVTYLQRPNELCDESVSSWYQVLSYIYNEIPISNDEIALFTTTMCPLFSRYDEMYDEYKKTKVAQLAVHPSKHYYMNNDKNGANFSFGQWHGYSQGLKPMYQISTSGVVAPIGELRETGYSFPLQFEYFPMAVSENLDIDTEEEFEMAQVLYQWKVNKALADLGQLL